MPPSPQASDGSDGSTGAATAERPCAWELRRAIPPGPAPWTQLARTWDLSPAAARLAWLRGLDRPEDLAWRLDPAWERTSDPYRLEGMAAAVGRIRRALDAGEGLLVYGDYDVDGVTATALLVRVLERLGGRVDFFIPNRFSDGYGLHLDCVRELVQARGPGLAISVDCGIRSPEVVSASREMGLDWIITDHHALGPVLPEACAVLHPELGECPVPGLAGVGVAFKLAQALLGSAAVPPPGERAFLDGLLKLVALGSLADMAPLTGENALLVKRGLESLSGTNGPGLAALLKAAGIGGRVRGQDVAYQLGPRMNAAGRLGAAEEALRLLLCRDADEAERLVGRVEALNRERRHLQASLAEALGPPGPEAFDLIVHPEAHKGVIGILAGQRMRQSGRPAGVCMVQDGVAHCSLRAPEGYDLNLLLAQASPFILKGGGHRVAAGVSFELGRLRFVQQCLVRGAAEQAGRQGPRILATDGWGPGSVPEEAELLRLEPFGNGFPAPLAVLDGHLKVSPQPFGEGHLRLTLEGLSVPATWFRAPEGIRGLQPGTRLCLACGPQDHPRFGRSWVVEESLQGGLA